MLRFPTQVEPETLQRASGDIRLRWGTRQDRTALGDLYQRGCLKARLPRVTNMHIKEAILINTAGGLTDGDRLTTHIDWGAQTIGIVTSQAAERIYKSRGTEALVDTKLQVADNAMAFWLPQETILFDGGRYRRTTDLNVSASSRALAVESIVFGRTAMGETVTSGSARDIWRVTVDQKLCFHDRFAIEGDIAAKLRRPAVAGGGSALASILYVGPDAEDSIPLFQRVLDQADIDGGVSCLGRLNVVRLRATDGRQLHRALQLVLSLVGAWMVTGKAELNQNFLPRVWQL